MSTEVLHDFLIMFRGDTSGVEKGAKQATKSTTDLEKSLGGVEKNASKAGGSFFTFATKAAGALGALLSIKHVAGEISEVAKLNDDLGDLADSLGANAGMIQAFGGATVSFGGSVQQFGATLKGVNEQLNMFATTGHSRAAPFFEKLNIKMTDAKGKARDFMDILPELSKRVEGMSKRQSAGILGRMGIDDATIRLIQQGGKEVDALIKRQKELGVVNKQDLEVAGKYADSLDDLNHVFNSVYTKIGTAVLPAFTWLINKITDGVVFLLKHKPLVVGALIAIGSALSYMMAPTLLAPFITGLTRMIFVVRAFGLSMLWSSIQGWLLNAAVLAIPLLIIAAIAAFALLFEDIYTWINGGNSLIGKWLGSWVDFKEKVTSIFNDLSAWISGVWDGWSDMVGNVTSTILDFFQGMGDSIKEVWQQIYDWIAGIFNKIGTMWEKAKGYVSKLNPFSDSKGDPATIGGNRSSEIGTAASTQLGEASASPLNSVSSHAISNSSKAVTKNNKVEIGKVEIKTNATDADGMGAGAAQSLQTHLQNAQDEYDDGIDS